MKGETAHGEGEKTGAGHGHDAGQAVPAKQEGGFVLRQGDMMAVLLAALVISVAFNQYQISALYALPIPAKIVAGASAGQAGGSAGSVQGSAGGSAGGASGAAKASLLDVRPKGTPAIYGSELGVKYDDVSEADPALANQAIAKLSKYDTGITLQGAELERYVKIGSSIACEYCCGAKSLVFANGQAACGCAHSYAMRGLAKYLIKNHGSEYTDDQILEELGKWKVLFFPGVHAQKAAVLESQGVELNYVNLASNKYRGAEKGASGSGGSMVGGC